MEVQAKIERENKKAQEDAKIQLAVEYENAGEKDLAEAIIEQPTIKTTFEIPKAAQAQGIQYRWNYGARVLNVMELAKAVVAGKAPAHYITANIVALNASAKSMKEDFIVPGVELTKTRSVAVGGR